MHVLNARSQLLVSHILSHRKPKMSNPSYVKGECRTCGGPLEFPAEGAGGTVACPHCGQATVLLAGRSAKPAAGGGRQPWVWLSVAGVLAAGAAVWFLAVKPGRPGAAAAPTVAAKSATNPVPPVAVVPVPPAYEEVTNEFGISTLTLEKTPGSSLVNVTGKVHNLAGRQRFGVKIELRLLDTNDLIIGRATDYNAVIEPNADWGFKALVMESKAVGARFGAIGEQ
jgi:hypothetical protein